VAAHLGGLEERSADSDLLAEPVPRVDLAQAAVERDQHQASGGHPARHLPEGPRDHAAVEVDQRVEGDDPRERRFGKREPKHVAQLERDPGVEATRQLDHPGREVEPEHLDAARREIAPDVAGPAAHVAHAAAAGDRGREPVDVAREMLAAYGSLAEVAARDATELARVAGVGPAKAARLVAAFELTRRLRARTPGVRIVLSSPAEVYAAYAPLMEDLKREVFRVALLDAQNGLLRDRVISEGTLSASLVHPYLVFKPAILESAASVILLHNHPSGDPTPSRE